MKEGWEYKKLGEVCQVLDSQRKPVTKKDRTKGIYPYYGATGIQDYVDSYIFDGRFLLVGEDGAKWGASDKTAYIIEGKSWVNNHAHILKVLENVNDRLLEYCLTFKDLSEYITGAVVPKLTQKALVSIPIPIPPLSEQQHIVEELDLLSSIIEKKKAQLNELDNLAQSLFYEMFGDPITNEKGWEVKKLKEACTCITDGDHMPPPKVDKGIPFITISNIDKQNREIDFRDTFFVPQSYYDSINKERKAQIDDVLYTVTGSYGIPIIVKEDRNFCFQRHIALLRPNKHLVSPCYLCYWALCKSIKYLADDVATGIAQKTVGLSSLRKFPIIIPPLSLQQQFASKIEAIEHQKELIKQSIKEVETLFNSRMDYYFN